MNWDLLLFGIAPYIALALALGVSLYRYKVKRFSYSSLSSQFLERKLLFWGSIPFHWGVVTILTGHLLAFLVPPAILAWNGEPVRLYLLEGTGLALGLWALGGLSVLFWRRMHVPRIQAVSSGMDFIVLVVLAIQLITGVATALTIRWGSNWFAAVAAPYLWSLAYGQPRIELIADLPVIVKAHIFNYFVFLGIFAFSRLVHIVTVPFHYAWRPWQVVIWNRLPGVNKLPPSLRPKLPPSQRVIHLPKGEAVPQLQARSVNGNFNPHEKH